MLYTLRLIFEGVCAFVPDDPFFTFTQGKWVAGKPKELTVLFPDLRKAGLGAKKRLRDAHFPAVLFDLETLVRNKTTRFVDLVVREDGSNLEHGVCLLRQECLSLVGTEGRPADFKFAATVPQYDVPVKRDDFKSVFWLPRISEIQPGYQLANTALNPAKFRLMPPELVGTFSIERGFFRCFAFNRDESGDPRVWRFAKEADLGQGVWNRAVGNRWALEISDLTDPVTLKMELRTNDPMETTLSFFPKASEQLVEIEFSNLEPEQLFADSGLQIEGSPDPDFEEFCHRVSSKGAPTDPVIPNLKRGSSSLGDVRKPCAPAAFSKFG